MADKPDATLAELAQIVGVAASPSLVYRALKDLGISRKEKNRAAEQDHPEL